MIKIICVGKIKEDYLKKAIDDYLNRINKYHKIQIIEIPDTNVEEEKDKILKNINSKDYVITLEIEGTPLNSIELSKKIDGTLIHYSTLTFIIGSSTGLSDEVKEQSNYHLSFSPLTFPHGLFRVILLEQIYRSFKIINNETYHK